LSSEEKGIEKSSRKINKCKNTTKGSDENRKIKELSNNKHRKSQTTNVVSGDYGKLEKTTRKHNKTINDNTKN